MTDIDTSVTLDRRTTRTERDKRDFASGKAVWVQKKKWKKGKIKSIWDFEDHFVRTIRIVCFSIGENSRETVATTQPKDEFPLSVIKKTLSSSLGH